MAVTEQFTNNASTTVNQSGFTNVSTSLTVASAAGFPAQAQFRILVESELMLVTAGAGTTTWTVTRGIEGTTAVAHALGVSVVHVVTAGALAQAFARLDQNNYYPSALGASGLQVSPVVTASSQLFNDGFEGAAVQPTLYGSTVVQSNDFETAPATVDYFHSIGTEALGTLAGWNQSVGAWSIASNVVTQTGANGAILTGHADWGDSTFFARVKWVTGSFPRVLFHSDAAAAQSVIVGSVDGTTMYLDKYVNPTYSTVSSVAAALTNGNFYWFKIQGSGTTYTLTLYNDSAGAIGTQVATTSGTIADAVLQTGYIGFGSRSATQVTFGGAFANVCYVTGPAPTGWTTNVPTSWGNANEPAFCWSQKQAYYGSASLSIYHALAAVTNTFWQGPASSALANGTSYQINGWAKVVNGAGGLAIRDGLIGGFAITSTTSATWAPIGASYTGTGATVQMFAGPLGGGTGTVYFDYATIVQPTTPTGILFNSLGAPLGGFTPTGTLAAWNLGGSPIISSNVVTCHPNETLWGGHLDWTDGYALMRFQAVANSRPSVGIHSASRATTNDSVYAGVDFTNLYIGKGVAGVFSSIATTPYVVSAGSWYWIVLQATGNIYTATLYKDAGGYIGDQVATTNVTDASTSHSGCAFIGSGGGASAAFLVGGNYPGTFLVQGPLPTGWTPTWVAGEPAFAWSKVSPYGGTYSGSVYNNDSGATGKWVYSGALTTTATQYATSGYIKAIGAGQASINLGGLASGAVSQDNKWHYTYNNDTFSAGAQAFNCNFSGAGTAYFDGVAVLGTAASANNAYGLYTNPTLVAAGNNDTLINKYGIATVATGTYSGLTAIGYKIDAASWTKTGTGTIATAVGLVVTAPTIGATNYAALFTGGFVGIGNSNPASQLDVSGSITSRNLTGGQIVFPTSAGLLTGDTNLVWDNANKRLGVGVTPTVPLHVVAPGTVFNTAIFNQVDTANPNNGILILQNNGSNRWYVTESGHVISAGSTPTLGALQTGISSQSIAGTDGAFKLTLVGTASAPAAGSQIAIVNFASNYGAVPSIVATVQGSNNLYVMTGNDAVSGFTLQAGAAMVNSAGYVIKMLATGV